MVHLVPKRFAAKASACAKLPLLNAATPFALSASLMQLNWTDTRRTAEKERKKECAGCVSEGRNACTLGEVIETWHLDEEQHK